MRVFYAICLSIIAALPARAQFTGTRLDSLFRKYYADGEPGAAVSVRLHGARVFEKGYGLAIVPGSEKISSRTCFNIGSLTKQFTAFSILRLAAENRLSLNDALIRYFPQFNRKVGSVITIRQLLSHRSGIVDHYENAGKNHLVHASDNDVLAAVQDIDSTYFAPGTAYRYSNTAYCLLALIIEKVTGLSYRDYLRRNIFHPLHMSHSDVWRPDMILPEKATGYDTTGHPGRFSALDANQSVFFSTEGDGGIYTCLEDYLKWLDALRPGSQFFPGLVKMAQSPGMMIDTANKLSYGYGWFVSQAGPHPAVYHTGSNGGFRALVFTIPAERDEIVIFSNRADIDLELLLVGMLQILHIQDKYFTKINGLVSFNYCSPNFAPCKETPLYSTSSGKNLNASDMASN